MELQEAIKQQANFVIIVPTNWDRTELPVRDNFYNDPTTLLQDFLQDSKDSAYDPAKGIDNINYTKENNSMIFETIFSLVEEPEHEYRKGALSKEKIEAVKQYINHIYDSSWKKQMDKWILSDGVCQLHSNNIPFSIERGMLWDDRQDVEHTLPSYIPKKYIRHDNELIGTGTNLYPLKDLNDVSKDPGYHSEPEGQVWIANLYKGIIKDQT